MAASSNPKKLADGIVSGRLPKTALDENFTDVHPPLDPHEALVASDRCYFCYDAPCVTACPTAIDIPLFIRQISTGNTLGAAETIFDQNILGGMCARVCPTETLCEQACVREAAEGKPVTIGLLQRFATDEAMQQDVQFFERQKNTGKKIAVVGAGPAGLACAHRLALYGHDVTIYEARKKPGGLNEFGIATYKTVDDFAQHEVDYVTAIGGIDIRYASPLGKKLSLDKLRKEHDAVFLGMGLAGVNALGLKGATPQGVRDAVEFIAELRQAKNKGRIPIGRRVVVIGGGMTAVDCAVQAKLLGAEEVTICYRRGQKNMNASPYEQELATSHGVTIRDWVQPAKLKAKNGQLTGITLEYTRLEKKKLVGTGEKFSLEADQVFRAIGQTFGDNESVLEDELKLVGGHIATVDAQGQTSLPDVWAGGDCIADGEDLTVTAVAQGRDSAEAIHQKLMG